MTTQLTTPSHGAQHPRIPHQALRLPSAPTPDLGIWMTWISTWKGSEPIFHHTKVTAWELSRGGEVKGTSSGTNQKQSKPHSSDRPRRFLVLGRNGEASDKHALGQEAGQQTLVIHPSAGVWGSLLLIWGAARSPPRTQSSWKD